MDSTINTPALSAVMIVHNGEAFIASAIESVLSQSFSDFEFLILNDGSTDATQEIINSYAQKDKRVKSLKNETNRGLSFSRNTIMNTAKGTYILTADADDLSISTRFATQYQFMKDHPEIDVLGSSVKLMNDSGKVFETWNYPLHHKEIVEGLKQSCIIANPSSIFKKTVFEKVNGYNEDLTICEDWDFFVRAAPYFKFANFKEPQILYRVHNNNISKNKLEHTIIYSTYLNNKLNASHMGSGIKQTAIDFPGLKDELAVKTIQFYTFWMDTYSKLGYKKLSEELFDVANKSYFPIFKTTLHKRFLKISTSIFLKRGHFLKSVKTLTEMILK